MSRPLETMRYLKPVYEWITGRSNNTPVVESKVKVSRDIIKLEFNGSDKPVIDDTSVYTSQIIDISKYKRIDFFVTSLINSENMTIRFVPNKPNSSSATNMRFYDWNSDSWVANTATGKVITIPRSPQHMFVLSSHPDFYWVQNLMVNEIKVSLKSIDPPKTSTSNVNEMEVWFVGEHHE